MAWTRVSPDRLAQQLGELPHGVPAYQALAARLRRLTAEGRLGRGTQLPSERALALALGLSRTTVTRAYGALVETGYATARQGSGTVTEVPGGSSRDALGGLITARPGGDGVLDLTCAAPAAVPDTHAALTWAVEQMPAQVRGSGYYPEGLPELRERIAARYTERGLPTTPDEVIVTAGALAGLAITARLLVSPGTRVLTETPSYPNAMEALRSAGARIVGQPVDGSGWDVAGLETTLRRATPRLALLMPDFHNPTGALMDHVTRERVARALAHSGTVAVVDESSAELALDPGIGPLPLPFAAPAGSGADVVLVGSASKLLWGGLRIGWIRAPRRLVPALVEARATMDLGSSVLDQLAVTYLLDRLDRVVADRRQTLRQGRDTLAGLLAEHLPDWSVPLPPGGLNLWCRLPGGYGPALTVAAQRAGVLLVPAGRFAVDGGMPAQQRLPFTLDATVYPEAVRRLVVADVEARDATDGHHRRRDRAARPGADARRPLIA